MYKILHIDDEELIRLFLKEFFENFYKDIELVSLDNWKAAKELLQKGEVFDLIILDEVMPEITGSEIYEEIRKEFSSMKELVIFMTGSKNFDFTDRPYIKKPFDLNDLHALINKFKVTKK